MKKISFILLLLLSVATPLFAQQKLQVLKNNKSAIQQHLPKNYHLVCTPYVVTNDDHEDGYIIFYSKGDTLDYAMGQDVRFGFDDAIIGLYISASANQTCLIDTFKNIGTCIAVRSVFLANADKNPSKELSIITASYDDASFLHCDIFETRFYHLPNHDASLSTRKLERLKIDIASGSDCAGPSGNITHDNAATAASIKNRLKLKGFQQ